MDKIERKNLLEQQRRIKPGECLKYIRVNIDPEFLCGEPGSQILSSLVNLGVKYSISSQRHPRTITWERAEAPTLQASKDILGMSEKFAHENYVLYLMLGEEFVQCARDSTFKNVVQELLSKYKDKSLTMIIFGLKKYCGNNKSGLRRKTIEKLLTEIQILYNVSHRLHETSCELANTVSQFSKAIAEIPFKKQQSEKYGEANFFALNDNKDCVRVDGSAGFSRLWQQHLTRLPLVTLETAEAIMNEYSNPRTLIDAYDENETNGEGLLADIKIRRAGGPLTSVRRVGPELSRKIHTLYNSLNPNDKL